MKQEFRNVSVALVLAGIVGFAQPNPAPAIAEDQRLLPYAEPGELVNVGGRRMNLRCTGAGGPTVILMAGLSSWSFIWYKAQPVIAQKTRVCAFDRAGFGFSDPAPKPQIISDVVDDLHAALKAGSIPEPYVLVGHSLGGVEARLYAQRWPKEVAGMVLVDTSPAGEGLIDQDQPGFEEVQRKESYASNKLHCALLAAHGPLDPADPEYEHCAIGPVPIDTPVAVRKIWPSFFTAYYAADQVSLMSSLYTHRYDSVDHLQLGAMPLVVLSIEAPWGTFTNYNKVWNALHADLARLSSRGVHRIVEGSSHEVQLDKPQAVIDAVDEVLSQLRAAAKPWAMRPCGRQVGFAVAESAQEFKRESAIANGRPGRAVEL
jgi:pimeloyl-ACP methyl ester carboxylesterase